MLRQTDLDSSDSSRSPPVASNGMTFRLSVFYLAHRHSLVISAAFACSQRRPQTDGLAPCGLFRALLGMCGTYFESVVREVWPRVNRPEVERCRLGQATVRSSDRYWIASLTWGAWIDSLCSRSAIVRAPLRILVYARADSPSRLIAVSRRRSAVASTSQNRFCSRAPICALQ